MNSREKVSALENAFSNDNGLGYVTLWQSQLGLHSKIRYGLYKKFTLSMLVGRLYDIELWTDDVSIFWTDVVYDEKLKKVSEKI